MQPDSQHRSRYLRYNSFIMPQCASSITAAFSSASRAARSLLSFRLLALLGLKGAFVCPFGRRDIGCRYVRGVQGYKVGSFPPPDELAGICTGWITRQRESIIQKKERKHRACGPRVPFPIQGAIFPKCGRLEKRTSLGGARVGQRGVGGDMRLNFSPLWLPPDQIQEWKCRTLLWGCQGAQTPLLWWMSVGFRTASCLTRAGQPLSFLTGSSLINHISPRLASWRTLGVTRRFLSDLHHKTT